MASNKADTRVEEDEKDRDDSGSEASSSDDDDELGLEGVLVRHPDASSSSSEDEEEDGGKEGEKDSGRFGDDESVPAAAVASGAREKRSAVAPANAARNKQPKKQRKQSKASRKRGEPEVLNVTFTFCDMDERYFHALRSLLHASGTVYQRHASELTDHIIDNVSVGTLVSMEDDPEGNVYGFASVLSVAAHRSAPALQYLRERCLEHCPDDRRAELEVVLGGATRRPAGLLLLGRMVNLPLEITLELYRQLAQDMDWAVAHAEGGPEARAALDFGVLLRLAPCQREGGAFIYRFFEDELWAGRGEFVFQVEAPQAYSREEKQYLSVMALTRQGFLDAVKDFERMVGDK